MQHRIVAWLAGELPTIPESLTGQLNIRHNAGSEVVIETPGELAPLLGWLSTLPLKEVRIEPIGLRAVYDRFHAEPVVAEPLLARFPTLAQSPGSLPANRS